ncbi:uncharacterized protein LOC108916137 isoform X1 [Anoplophora glabripennis]|uniref:uncharacterized protein LOC108916137 isoform X1 n=1 Tax=Anoplophora glabripennis TaxID=217634 RepID=UPI0008753F85|nr:uncharacterized protein LOC108916137 isoform X1 [Anoplophora glabripennis]
MSCRVNDTHWEIIFNYFQIHPNLATGRAIGPNARQIQRQQWEELANNLNALGYGTKTSEKWQKTWTDFKQNLKKKAIEIKKDQQATGGGPSNSKKFTKHEERVLSILGSSFYEGMGCSEVGLPTTDAGISPFMFSENSRNVEVEFVNEQNIEPRAELTNVCSMSTSSTSADIMTVFCSSPTTPLAHDHIYTQNKKRKRDKYSDEYEETINVLKDIKNTIDSRLAEIANILHNIIDKK